MQKSKNIIGLIGSSLMIISIFLPWLSVKSSASFMGYSQSFESGGISGFSIGDAWLAFFVSIVGIVLSLKNIKWSAICGLVNLIIGLGFVMGWRTYNAGTSVSFESSYGSASASVNVQIGIYLLLIGAAVLIISTVREFIKKNDIPLMATKN